jgi:hypothetical protein
MVTQPRPRPCYKVYIWFEIQLNKALHPDQIYVNLIPVKL